MIEKDKSPLSPREQAELYYEQGREHWRNDRRGAAMSAYAKAAELDPQSPAVEALKMARQIMAFYNPDQFNP
jgi:Flp pilus assembly protein TadD